MRTQLPAIDMGILAKTPDHRLTKAFPGYTRGELRDMKAGLAEQLREDARRAKFLRFLSSGRLEKEIIKEFGSLDMLNGKYEGYRLYTQRNEYNEAVHILLPEIRKEAPIEKKEWSFYRGSDTQDGEVVKQPYLLVQMPDKLFRKHEAMEVYPIFDVHHGHSAHKLQKLISYVQWIGAEDNRFAVIGGDLMENALDDARGMTYDQSMNPTNQLQSIVSILRPIAHKILVAIPGNHEWRTYKHAGIDPMMVVAEQLEVPYFDGPVFMSILAGGYKWRAWVHHGTGNSNTKGGKLNAAGKSKNFLGFIEFDVSGHVHDPISNPETFLIEDERNCRLVYKQRWTVIASSFLRWENTYAYRKEYGPSGIGGVCMEMSRNGSYRAIQK